MPRIDETRKAMMTSVVDIHDKNEQIPLDTYSQALRALQFIWPETTDARFKWDNLFGLFTTPTGKKSYPTLFGSYPIMRKMIANDTLRSNLGMIRRMLPEKRWSDYQFFPANLPEDSIIFTVINGLVVVSIRSGSVLKVLFNRPQKDNEIRSWEIALSAGIDAYLPRVINSGEVPDGGEWIVREFVPNGQPLHRSLNPFISNRKVWRHWLKREILPVLERFYQTAGIDYFNMSDLFDELKLFLCKNEGVTNLLRYVLYTIEKRKPLDQKSKVAYSLIHGDLSASHIHRNNGKWWIIDWGSSHYNGIVRECFLDYFRYPDSTYLKKNKFWPWLRGEIETRDISRDLKRDIELFIQWNDSSLGVSLDAEDVRSQIIYFLIRYILKKIRVWTDTTPPAILPEEGTMRPGSVKYREVAPAIRQLAMVRE